MSAKSKSKQEEALQFLDDLDSLAPPPSVGINPPTPGAQTPAEGEAEVFAFIDEITQKSSEPPRSLHLERPLSRAGTPTLRKSTERVKVGVSAPLLPSSVASPASMKSESSSPRVSTPVNAGISKQESQSAAGGWGWGNVWSSASAAIQQAKSVVDEQVKTLPKNEQARKWGEGVLEYAKAAQLDKLGQDLKRVGLSTFTDILNVVAPPISEHEVIQVWLSHDMQGYDGVESLVYSALARIMEQVEGGDLTVNRGDESRPKDSTDSKRDLNAVEGYEAAYKLAQANLHELTTRNVQPQPQTHTSTTQNPTTYSYIYLRIQPFFTSIQLPQLSSEDSQSIPETSTQPTLQFILYMSDPTHQLTHSTVTQAIPSKWLELWDKYDWVEDLVVEALRVGVEVIGQEYIGTRMGWDKEDLAAASTTEVKES